MSIRDDRGYDTREDRVYDTRNNTRYETGRKNIVIKKTALPTIGGVLLIIAGLLNFFSGIGVSVAGAALDDFFDITGAIFAGIPMIIIGIITLAGGIVAVMRRVWWLALVGGILAVLPSAGWLFGVPGLILVSIARLEFKYRDALEEERETYTASMRERAEPERRPMTEPMRQETAPRAETSSMVRNYLRGLDFPASKNEISMFARSNGAPDMVMTYMNRLPNRQYNSQSDVEDEFSKIR